MEIGKRKLEKGEGGFAGAGLNAPRHVAEARVAEDARFYLISRMRMLRKR